MLGVEEFAEDQHPETEEACRAQIDRLQEIFLTRDRDEWIAELMFENTCVTPVLSLDEVLANPNHRERGSILAGADIGEGFEDQVGVLFRMSKTPGSIRRAAPEVGQDTRDVLAEIGLSESEIETLLPEITTA